MQTQVGESPSTMFPLHKLPPELRLEVFSYLDFDLCPFSENLPSVVRALGPTFYAEVSLFYKAAQASKQLVTFENFCAAFRKVDCRRISELKSLKFTFQENCNSVLFFHDDPILDKNNISTIKADYSQISPDENGLYWTTLHKLTTPVWRLVVANPNGLRKLVIAIQPTAEEGSEMWLEFSNGEVMLRGISWINNFMNAPGKMKEATIEGKKMHIWTWEGCWTATKGRGEDYRLINHSNLSGD